MNKTFPMRVTVIFFVTFLFCLVLLISCNNKDKTISPCDGNGSICFNNKTDSIVKVTIKEAPDQFSLEPDYLKCVSMKGNVLYTINIEGRKYYKDTLLVLQVCDKKDFVIQR
jgi:hypothetical protein